MIFDYEMLKIVTLPSSAPVAEKVQHEPQYPSIYLFNKLLNQI